MTEACTLRALAPAEPLPWDLLLSADPSADVVHSYIGQSTVWVAEADTAVIGVCVVEMQAAGHAEIRNLAVAPHQQGTGIGKALVQLAAEQARQQGVQLLRVSTGNSSLGPLALYQKLGFDIVELRRHFFTDYYARPIWENGIRCQHLLVLEKELLA